MRTDERHHDILDATEKGDAARTQALLGDNRKLVAFRDKDERTALHYAACFGHADVAMILLSQGASLDARDREAYAPLHYAARKRRLAVPQVLAPNGADLDVRGNEDATALRVPAGKGRRSIAELILSHGFGANAQNQRGEAPLQCHEEFSVCMLFH